MDDSGHIAVLVNPASRRGAGAEHADAVVGRLTERGATVRTYRGAGPDDTVRLAKEAVAAGPEVLAVVGGDGTIAAVLPHVIGTGVPLAPVGGGTGNDLARMHGIPPVPRDAADVVLDGARTLVDTGTITGDDGTVTAFATIACAGFDSRANERINRMRHPRGAARYTLGTHLELLGLRTFSYRLTLDPGDDPVETRGHLLAIGNTRYYGGGRPILPVADARDGLLDITLVEDVGRLGLIGLDRPIRRGEHLGRPGVRALRAASVRVEAGEDLVMYADGEPVGPLPVTVTAHHRTLTLCLPRDGGRP
ncbi:diacylglycerol/lipid kinase family protein [Myceligenerans pegani]|uniref:Diacylglycerol kinase n=1 Tax=Myceligenerans pegani TaxID=2776917 RepID=A0ABR9N3K8_9MICO|nr:diacylglycerol kinase family protein [Myceligenerans sp. TRM 65318]MBE1877688.1 diacylglycerol kinase [Myceligenerans sp. TRM 65318]MBE3019959.1 diacylglycerol kinase [Myceligenerans sp. TRM 65318]